MKNKSGKKFDQIQSDVFPLCHANISISMMDKEKLAPSIERWITNPARIRYVLRECETGGKLVADRYVKKYLATITISVQKSRHFLTAFGSCYSFWRRNDYLEAQIYKGSDLCVFLIWIGRSI